MMQSEEKLCVVVLFGGMSSEHEVSCVSAGTFVDNLKRKFAIFQKVFLKKISPNSGRAFWHCACITRIDIV